MNRTFSRELLTLIATVFSLTANAERIPEDEAARIATEFFQSFSNGNISVVGVEYQGAYSEDTTHMDSYIMNDVPTFYIFNEAGGNGYVIVSGDDKFPSIIGYSLEDSWPENKDMVPEALGWALETYSLCVESARNGEAIAPMTADWYKGTPYSVVGPLLTTKWNQHYPYNKYAPEIYPAKRAPQRFNGHYATGCGSIATSQIINYWKKPEHPLERKTCYRVKDYVDGNYRVNTYEVTLDPNTFYDYSIIPDSIDSTAVATPWMTEAEWERKGDELAKFIRDVAYVLNLGWTGWTGGGGSDAYGYEQALVQGFDFSLDAYTIALEGMSQLRDPEIMRQMRECLDAGMPIICRGTDTGGRGGHVFVFDGYDSNDFVHVNWGWGGNCNNWFDPGFLLTNMYDTKQKRNYNFSQDNSITLNLHPRTEPESVHLDQRQIKPLAVSFISSEDPVEDKLLGDRVNKPVCYLDRATTTVSEEFSALSFLKNLGYDYDFVFRLTDESSTKTSNDTIRFYGNTLDTRWIDADISCSNSLSLIGRKDGLYSLSGSMRQVLNGETGQWKEAAHGSQIRLSGNDIIMNPSVYDSYYHAPQCHHNCDGKNQLLVHIDYLNDPKSLIAGDTLRIQLNVTGISANAFGYEVPEADTLAVLVLSHGEQNDTIIDNTKPLCEFIAKSQTGKAANLVNIQTLPVALTEPGIYTLTYSWPAMGVSIRDEFTVESPTLIETITTPSSPTLPHKFLKGNSVYIHSDGSTFNIQGNKVRVKVGSINSPNKQ